MTASRHINSPLYCILLLLGHALAAPCAFAQFDKKVPAPVEQSWNPETTFPPLEPADAMKTGGSIPRTQAEQIQRSDK